MARFEVWQDGHCKMGTDYRECVYPERTLRNMASAGCRFKWDGKTVTVKTLLEILKEQ